MFHHIAQDGQDWDDHKHSGNAPEHSARNEAKNSEKRIEPHIGPGDIGRKNIVFGKLDERKKQKYIKCGIGIGRTDKRKSDGTFRRAETLCLPHGHRKQS